MRNSIFCDDSQAYQYQLHVQPSTKCVHLVWSPSWWQLKVLHVEVRFGLIFFVSVFTKRLSWNGSLSVSVLGLLLTLLQRHPWSCPDVICSLLLWYLSLSNSLHLSVHNILSHTRFMNGIMENGKAIMSVSKFLSQKHRIFFFRIWKGNVVWRLQL